MEGSGHDQNQIFFRRSCLEGLRSTVSRDEWQMLLFLKVFADFDTLPIRW